MQVRILALLLAEFVAPPTVRQQAEPSSAMIANLRLSHFTLAQHFVSNKASTKIRATLNERLPKRGPPNGAYVYSLFLDCRLPQQFFLDSVVQLVALVIF